LRIVSPHRASHSGAALAILKRQRSELNTMKTKPERPTGFADGMLTAPPDDQTAQRVGSQYAIALITAASRPQKATIGVDAGSGTPGPGVRGERRCCSMSSGPTVHCPSMTPRQSTVRRSPFGIIQDRVLFRRSQRLAPDFFSASDLSADGDVVLLRRGVYRRANRGPEYRSDRQE